MLELHTSLAQEVNEKWGLNRGDDKYETGTKHRSTEEYKRDLSRECSLLENQRGALEESIKTGREELATARTRVRALTKGTPSQAPPQRPPQAAPGQPPYPSPQS